MKRLALCADDFGSFPGVNAGILRLVDAGRLGGVSCQVVAGAFSADAAALRERAGAVDLGLHLDLAADREALGALVARSHARALGRPYVRARIAAQLDAFERALGRAPAFVDGHQHVHQLPVVRDALLDVLASRYGRPGPLVRNTVPLHARGAKSLAVAALGGYGLRRELRARGVPHNPDFAGVYALDGAANYAALFQAWLAGAEDGTILLCHPGAAAEDPGDPIGPARLAELGYLSSAALDEDCRAAGVTRVRVSEVGVIAA